MPYLSATVDALIVMGLDAGPLKKSTLSVVASRSYSSTARSALDPSSYTIILMGSLALASLTKTPPRSFIIFAHSSMNVRARGPHSTEKAPVTAIVPPILISRACAPTRGLVAGNSRRTAPITTVTPIPSPRDLLRMSVPPSSRLRDPGTTS